MRLKEIDIVRPLLVILVVVYHAFNIYAQGWEPVDGYVDVPLYKWVDIYSYSFVLEAFVFISGFLYGYQIERNGLGSFSALVRKKIWRLLVPAWFWSVFYYLTLDEEPRMWYDLLAGIGHLWFLVMLFWCFVSTWFLLKQEFSDSLILTIAFVLLFISYNPLPFQIPRAMYYLFAFLIGVLLNNSHIFERLQQLPFSLILFIWGGYVLAVFICASGYLSMSTTGCVVAKIAGHGFNYIIQMTVALTGTFLVMITGLKIKNLQIEPCSLYRNVGVYGIGIYIFQQIVLKFFYYHTVLPAMAGPYILPWLMTIIALMLSYIFSAVLMKAKFGRIILGSK